MKKERNEGEGSVKLVGERYISTDCAVDVAEIAHLSERPADGRNVPTPESRPFV